LEIAFLFKQLLLTGTYPLVSIITLNYNKSHLTLQLIESLQRVTYPNVEILVCDMNSEKDQVEILSSVLYNKTKILYSTINRGFAGGNNWGIQQSNGEFILLLNNDTIVEADLVTKLLSVLLEQKNVGVVSPKIKRFHNRDVLEYAGFRTMNFYTGQTSSVGFNEVDGEQFNHAGETASSHGCAMMISRKTLDTIGGLCDDYFLYYEEWDLSLRLQRQKQKVWYEPSTTVYHLDSQSVGSGNPLKQYYLTRNRILLMRRFAAPHQLFIFILFFIFCSIPMNVIRLSIRKQFPQLKSFIKGIWWNLHNSSKPKFDLYRSKTC
jgi:GT2 family glycosyltransferase